MAVHDDVNEATVRRVVTGHRPDGLAVVIEDEMVPGAALAEAPDRTRCQVLPRVGDGGDAGIP